jgi:hypothetical protein
MAYTAANDLSFVPQAADRQPELRAQVPQAVAAAVAQLDVLELLPDAFLRIEVGRIARQAIQPQPRRGPRGQEILDNLAAVNRRAVPDDQELARDLPQQVAQKADDAGTPEGDGLDHMEQPPFGSNATDDREMIAGQGNPQHRGVPTWSVGPHDTRQQIEPGFVYPDDRTAFGRGFFLSAGQRSVCQAVMAASSRWLARWVGFWTLQPSRRRRRLICAG